MIVLAKHELHDCIGYKWTSQLYWLYKWTSWLYWLYMNFMLILAIHELHNCIGYINEIHDGIGYKWTSYDSIGYTWTLCLYRLLMNFTIVLAYVCCMACCWKNALLTKISDDDILMKLRKDWCTLTKVSWTFNLPTTNRPMWYT